MHISARLRSVSEMHRGWAISLPQSLLKFLVEVVLVGLAVFLGLLANEWREGRQHQELAAATLRYFRRDATVNQQALLAERRYHETLAKEIGAFLRPDVPQTQENFAAKVHFLGVRPIIFEHTAWDLALATQSLSYLQPELAYALSRVQTRQQALETLENTYLQASFATQEAHDMAAKMQGYLIDVNIQEPELLKLYEELLPEIDKAKAH